MKTEKIKILLYPNATVARFNTRIEGEGPDVGRRAKHWVYKAPNGPGYIHEIMFLTSLDTEPIDTGVEFVSERIFWGKVRLVCQRQVFLPKTWDKINESVKQLEKMK